MNFMNNPTGITTQGNVFPSPAIVILAALALTGCKKDEDPAPTPPPANEEELITTVTLHFHSSGGAEHKHFEFQDLDGAGGNAPVIEADTLSADSTYAVDVEVLNESVSPAVDIAAEIQAEGEAHQFFFQVGGANATVAYTDADAGGNPIGLGTIWTIGSASSGIVTVTLRHQPDKYAAGVSAGDITNAGGDTDIEVTFPLVIQ